MMWLYFFGRVLLYGAEVNFIYSSLGKENARIEDTTNPAKETATAIEGSDEGSPL
jgi:uncharacterized BrkB/YihY/UPF0761 family membrane protein